MRRARIGERRHLGRLYDQLNERDFPFVAVIEFETEADLRAYLEHPAHEELGKYFYETSRAALVFDFELSEGRDAQRVFRG